jgi:hypothetical protein
MIGSRDSGYGDGSTRAARSDISHIFCGRLRALTKAGTLQWLVGDVNRGTNPTELRSGYGYQMWHRPESTPAVPCESVCQPFFITHKHTHSVNADKTPSRGSAASLSYARHARDSCCACASTSPAHARGKGLLHAVVGRRRLCTEVVDPCCSLWVAARRPGRGMSLGYPCARGRGRRRCCCWAAESYSWGCKCRR